MSATDLPPLVRAAAESGAALGFEESCLPEHGRLLALLAGAVGPGVIGETGTGAGVGLAWLASGAAPGARLVSVDRDPARAEAARALFAGRALVLDPAAVMGGSDGAGPEVGVGPEVTVLTGDWTTLGPYGPFDLLVLDGGGQGKGDEPPVDVERWVRPGGLVVLDDFTPAAHWPPTYQGRPDTARLRWLQHHGLLATELPLTPTSATIVARRLPASRTT